MTSRANLRARRPSWALLGIALATLLSFDVQAQGTPAEERNNSLGLYLWATGIDGDFTVMGNTVPVDVGFDELFDTVKIAASLHYEHDFDPWGLLADLTYVDTLSEITDPGSGGTATSELPFLLAELAAYHRWSPRANLEVDLLFGVRYWSLDQTLTISGAPMPFTGDQSWLDGMVGTRLLVPFGKNDKWLFLYRLDVAAGGSEIAWNTTAFFDWKFSKVASLLMGYRFLKEDYEDGAGSTLFALDAKFAGPLLGVDFHW